MSLTSVSSRSCSSTASVLPPTARLAMAGDLVADAFTRVAASYLPRGELDGGDWRDRGVTQAAANAQQAPGTDCLEQFGNHRRALVEQLIDADDDLAATLPGTARWRRYARRRRDSLSRNRGRRQSLWRPRADQLVERSRMCSRRQSGPNLPRRASDPSRQKPTDHDALADRRAGDRVAECHGVAFDTCIDAQLVRTTVPKPRKNISKRDAGATVEVAICAGVRHSSLARTD